MHPIAEFRRIYHINPISTIEEYITGDNGVEYFFDAAGEVSAFFIRTNKKHLDAIAQVIAVANGNYSPLL
jgi:hypothetical protein